MPPASRLALRPDGSGSAPTLRTRGRQTSGIAQATQAAIHTALPATVHGSPELMPEAMNNRPDTTNPDKPIRLQRASDTSRTHRQVDPTSVSPTA